VLLQETTTEFPRNIVVRSADIDEVAILLGGIKSLLALPPPPPQLDMVIVVNKIIKI
jgi:hypothetical protein